MIFVTVGTHEQPFNRLVSYMDDLCRQKVLKETVVIQTGYSTYMPEYCQWSKLYPYEVMADYVKRARIIITHGGPSSFIMALQAGKVPIVVPRQKKFREHVNDHQVEFAKAVEARRRNIIVVEDIEELAKRIYSYEKIAGSMKTGLAGNNIKFNEEFEQLVSSILDRKAAGGTGE